MQTELAGQRNVHDGALIIRGSFSEMLSLRDDEEVCSLEGQSLVLGHDLVVLLHYDVVSHIVQGHCFLKFGVWLDLPLFPEGAGQDIIWELI